MRNMPVGVLALFLIAPSSPMVGGGLDTARLDRYVRQAVHDYSVSGLAIGIVNDSSVIFQKGYGNVGSPRSEPVTATTLFPIGSCTKAFTCACLGILVDQHKIDWDDKVIKYLPGFGLSDPYVTSHLTIRDILSHRTGLGESTGDVLLFGTSDSRDELIGKIPQLPLKSGFRESYGYNNLMYLVAGRIIEAVTGETWEKFIEVNIFRRAGLQNTTTDLTIPVETAHLAFPHNEQGKLSEYWNVFNPHVGPAGSIISNIQDMNKWLQLLLHQGSLGGKRVLSQRTTEEIMNPQIIVPVSPYWKDNGVHLQAYGLGWKLFDYGGRLIVEHTGGGAGFVCEMVLIPEEKIGFVVLTNQMTWLASVVAYYVTDRILERPERDWSKEMLMYYRDELANKKQRLAAVLGGRRISVLPTEDLTKYVGTFRDPIYGEAEIALKDSALFFRLVPAPRLFDCTLEPWDDQKFKAEFPLCIALDFPLAFLAFDVDSQGKVEGFKISLLDDNMFTDYYFKKR